MDTNVRNDFWTNDGAVTGAGINPPSQAFNFTSTAALDGSVRQNGSRAVTLNVVGTPLEFFKKELLGSDKFTVVEATVNESRWQLTTMSCTQKDAAGNDQPVTGVTSRGRTITLDKVVAPLDTSKPNITCTFTNTSTSGSLTIDKVLNDPGHGLAKAEKLYTGSFNCGPNYTGTFSLFAGASKTIDSAYTWEPVEYTVAGPEGGQMGSSTTFAVPADGTKVLVSAANPIARSYGAFTVIKRRNPASGSTVKIGEKITYTLTAANTSKVHVHDVVLTDDLKSVMAASSLVGSPQQTQGSSAIAGQILFWNIGTLAAGETQTLSYAVQVNAGSGNATITTVVLGSAHIPPASCAAAVAAARSIATGGQTPSARAPAAPTHMVALPVVPPAPTRPAAGRHRSHGPVDSWHGSPAAGGRPGNHDGQPSRQGNDSLAPPRH